MQGRLWRGGQGRPWPPQLFITPSTIEKIKLSEIIRVIVINYGGQLVLDDVSRSVSSSNKVCFQNGRLDSNTCYYQRNLFDKFKFLHYNVDNDAVLASLAHVAVSRRCSSRAISVPIRLL